MVVLILADRGDPSVPAVVAALAERRTGCMLAWGDDLTRARPFGHIVDDDGPRLRVQLADGRRWTHRSVQAVLNRLRWLPPAEGRIAEADRAYAQQELTAITLSWLAALAERVPMLGRPAATGLAGAWRQPAEWALLIAAAGLRPHPVRLDGAREPDAAAGGFVGAARALVVLGEVFPDAARLDETTRAGLVRLAGLADADTLSVQLDAAGRIANPDVVPDLRLGGRTAAQRIAATLLRAATGGA